MLAPLPKAEVELELERLVGSWKALPRPRIDVAKQAGDLAADDFGFTSDAVRLNQQIDQAAGRRELEQRIADLRARIAEFDT